MNKISSYFLVWVAYNEESTLEDSFLAAKMAVEFYNKKTVNSVSANVIICHNGCTDRTPEIADEIKKKYSSEKLKINVISSEKGMVIAQNAAISCIRNQKDGYKNPIFFIDADSFVSENVIDVILDQFNKHEKLKAVGVQPTPISYKGRSPIKRFWDKVLNCRSYYPESEIAVKYAPEFHPYADADPQGVDVEFEKRSKIYFHGRCFALRDESIWNVDERLVGEDTFLDRSIHHRFGPGSTRTVHSAAVYYKPMNSIRVFSRTFFRIYGDLKDLKKKYPQYLGVREYSKTKLDWQYIKTIPFAWRIRFRVYHLTRQIFHFLFKHNLIYRKTSVFDVWSYKKKK